MSKVVTLRLPDDTAARLQATARRAGRSVSEVGARSIEEWLRQDEFADIEFRSIRRERHACLKGGPAVWKVIMVADDYDRDPERTAAHFQWPVHRVRAALNYAEAYPDEVERMLELNRSMTYERLKRILPQLELFEVPREQADHDEPS